MQDALSTFFKGPTLLADACAGAVSSGLLEDGRLVSQIDVEIGVSEGVLRALPALFEAAKLPPASLKCCALCRGVGSVLGVRMVSAALSTLAFASKPPLPLFSWTLFDAALLKGKELCAGAFALAVSSRKNYVNAAWFDGANDFAQELTYADFAAKFKDSAFKIFYIEQKKLDAAELDFLTCAPRLKINLKDVAAYALREGFLSPAALPPDALLLSKREYVKWNSQART